MENMVKFGPKQLRGTIWDEGGKTKILQILISHEEYAIHSIQFVYVVDGQVVRSNIHGEPNGLKIDVVTFDHPREYLVSVSGQYWDDKFGTNNGKYGPYGTHKDVYFYSKFVYNFGPRSSFGGFHGTVDKSCVYAIGVYVKPIVSLSETEADTAGKLKTFKPLGRSFMFLGRIPSHVGDKRRSEFNSIILTDTQSKFNYLFHRIYYLSNRFVAVAIHLWFQNSNLNHHLLCQMEDNQKFSPVSMELEGSIWDEGGNTDIVQILISHEHQSVNAIQFVYVVDGKLLRSEIHGRVISDRGFAAVGFDYPSEYLVSVSGRHSDYNGDLASITFGTNKRTYGPFGSIRDPFNADLYSFAYYFSPKTSFGGFHGCVSGSSSSNLSIGVYIRRVRSLVEFMTNSSKGRFGIHSIQFVYAVDGNLVRSEIHGELKGEKRFAAVGFDYPSEYLVSVSGSHRRDRLVWITFGTNKRTYGPFGTDDGADSYYDKFAYYFSPKSSFGGFHGCVRFGTWLRIGVYIKPVVSLVDFMTSS
ncbi:hypothetical protein LXL04_005401 [Taraxacum kok-saghyz]